MSADASKPADSGDDPAVLVALELRIEHDRRRGSVQSLAAYQAEFPGHERTVEREYRRLAGLRAETNEAEAVAEFEAMFSRDVDLGGPAPLARYLDRFPAYERTIAARYAALQAGDETEHVTEIGRTLGEFRIVREIGRGGMGVVFAAEQASLQRVVALKVLGAHLTLQGDAIERFKREARAAALVRHPSIVEVFAIGSEGAHHYFAMELVEGQSLDRRIAERQPRDAAAHLRDDLVLIVQVARALAAAHEAGVLHRDIKPSNILVRTDETAVLTDFGLAQDRGLPALSRTGDVVGTPCYVAPEQAGGDRADERSDVYSLGVTLYELLTSRRPFQGRTTHDILQRILRDEPPSPQRANPQLATDLVAIVLMAMEKDPQRRYQSASEFADDIEAFLEYRSVRARRTPWTIRSIRWIRRSQARTAFVILAVLAVPTVAALGGYLLAKRPAIVAGQDAIRRERLDRVLGDAFDAMALNELGRADAEFSAALSLAPHDVDARTGKIMVLHWLGRSQQALELARSDERLAMAVDWLHAQSNPDLSFGIELDASDDSHELFVGASLLAARPNAALRERVVRAHGWIRLAHQKSPRPRRAHVVLMIQIATVLENDQLIREAVEIYRAHWPLDEAARRHLLSGLMHIDPEEGASYASELIRQGHVVETTHYYLGMCEKLRGRRDAAQEAFEEGMRRFPSSDACRFGLGQLQYELRDFAACAATLRGLELDSPLNVEASGVLASALTDLGKLEEASKVIDDVIRRRPDLARHRCRRGRVRFAEGKLDAALVDYRHAYRLDPRNLDTLRGLAAVHGARKEAEPAIRFYGLALDQEPSHATTRMGLAKALSLNGKNTEAIELLRPLLENRIVAAEVHELIGGMYMIIGRFEAAVPHFEAAAAAGRERSKRGLVLSRRNLPLVARLENGDKPNDVGITVRLAALAGIRGADGLAIELYAHAFRLDPSLLNPRKGYAVRAARVAVRAGRLQQATRWLRQELVFASGATSARSRARVRDRMRSWLADPTLAALRDFASLDHGEETLLLWRDVMRLAR